MIIRRTNYSDNKRVSAIHAQDDFIWVGFELDSGVCILEKQFGASPDQVYFTLNKSVSKIKKMTSDDTYLYVAYEDDSLLGEIISLTNPLSTFTQISIPSGISEFPVDVAIKGSNLWFLIPGDASGTNAKLLRYNTSGVLQETVDLDKSGLTITNARSLTLDNNDEIWLVTYQSPATVVRVFYTTFWDFQETTIL
jgi:hypothetical protein